MSRNLKLALSIAGAVAIALVAAVLAAGGSSEKKAETETSTTSTSAQVLRANSHRLSSPPSSKVTLVEFLDFECESCGALYPVMEDLRKQYGDRVTFAIRYFPLPDHKNAQIAAQTVEAAARQDRLVDMYKKMFETQSEWGESDESKESTFIGFARELGLDMTKFKRDLKSQSTIQRVALDKNDGTALGVQGTPTLFLNGSPLELTSVEQIRADIESALAGQK